MPNHAADLVSRKAEFQAALLSWYRQSQRPLPWRTKPSVYGTVVSEFMLQQTQVKTVLPYFSRWMETFHDFHALASASEGQVLKLWEGLGYYSRARNLHRLAQAIDALPALPRTPDAWLALPGVGPYTAAAITSIAFGVPVACVDGNVVRILSRLAADETAFRDSATAAKQFGPLAGALVPAASPGDHNQAMMELGATVCVKSKPLCTLCPVYDFCAGTRTGQPERFPRLAPKAIERLTVARVWCEANASLLLHRAGASAKRLADLHELPTSEHVGLSAERVTLWPLLTTKRRGITRYQITERIHQAPPAQVPLVKETTDGALTWVPLAELERITLSGPHKRWISEILRAR